MTVGPTVTRFELELGSGVKVATGHQPAARHRLRDGRHGRPHPGPDPRALGDRHRGAQPHPAARRPRRPARVARGHPGHRPARGRRRQGHRRQGRVPRPGHDAAPADRRRHRGRQVERHQLHHHVAADAHDARPGPPHPDRPQAGRDGPVQPAAAPAHAAGHEPEEGRQRPRLGGQGDGASLRPALRGRLPGHRRLQRGVRPRRADQRRARRTTPPRRPRRPAAGRPRRQQLRAPALHRRRRRRAQRPDDGRRPGRRGVDHAHRPEGARRRHPPHRGHPAPERERDHRRHQGQRAGPHGLRRLEPHRLAGDPRPARRREARRQGRHAPAAGQLLGGPAHPGLVRQRGGGAQGRRPLAPPGTRGHLRQRRRQRRRPAATARTTSRRAPTPSPPAGTTTTR